VTAGIAAAILRLIWMKRVSQYGGLRHLGFIAVKVRLREFEPQFRLQLTRLASVRLRSSLIMMLFGTLLVRLSWLRLRASQRFAFLGVAGSRVRRSKVFQ
jgi:hypothetical protein